MAGVAWLMEQYDLPKIIRQRFHLSARLYGFKEVTGKCATKSVWRNATTCLVFDYDWRDQYLGCAVIDINHPYPGADLARFLPGEAAVDLREGQVWHGSNPWRKADVVIRHLKSYLEQQGDVTGGIGSKNDTLE
ncbi:MAG: hypothetical protein ABL949_09520 [Fimbriimonadaceae bacterium]